MTTDKMLDYLSTIGRPRVVLSEDGAWYASIEFSAPEGVTAKVASDFKHKTHRAALECVIERLGKMRSMMKALPEREPQP